MTTTLHSDSDVSPRPARALPWYAFGLAGSLFHEPAAAPGATVHGSALVAIDWLILTALWYVSAGESWGLPQMRTETSAVGSEQS